jgi:hypothetical protein
MGAGALTVACRQWLGGCVPAAAAAVARDRVANVLLAYKGRNNVGGGARAAGALAVEKAASMQHMHASARRLAAAGRDCVALCPAQPSCAPVTCAPALCAEDIARATARELLGPLLDAVCARLGFVLRKVFEIAADRAAQMGEPPGLNK